MFTAFRQQSFDGGVIVEARYYGPFNALLNYCFPETSQIRFIVTPHVPPHWSSPATRSMWPFITSSFTTRPCAPSFLLLVVVVEERKGRR